MSGLIVAFHSDDPLYRGEARRMKASADRLALPTHIEVVAASSWLEIVRSKVDFLIAKRRRLRGPLLYVDVDAIFHADPWPLLAAVAADVSFAVLLDQKARSGTIYLADTEGARHFLDDWRLRLHQTPGAWDQHPLNDIAREAAAGNRLDYSWSNLAPGLCYIFDRAETTAGPGIVAVIEHLQASRDLTAPGSVKQQRRHDRLREIDAMLGRGGGRASD